MTSSALWREFTPSDFPNCLFFLPLLSLLPSSPCTVEHMMPSFKLFLLVLVWFVSVSLSQPCYRDCELPLTSCANINYNVYPIGLNVSKNEQEAAEFFSEANTYLTGACQAAVQQYICPTLYLSCENTTVLNTTTNKYEVVPKKIKPCLSQCNGLHDACSAYTDLFKVFLNPEQQDLINCSRKDIDGTPYFFNDTGIPDAEEKGQCYTLYNLTTIPRCTNQSVIPPPVVVSGNCEAYDPSLTPHTSAVCGAFVDKEIFVFSVASQALADQQISNLTDIVSKVWTVLPMACYKRALSLLCQTAFPSCTRVSDQATNATYAAPVYPCYESCQDVLTECGYLLGLLGPEYSSLINCSARNILTGQQQWPDGPNYDFAATSSFNTSIACSTTMFPDDAYASFVTPTFVECPAPLAPRTRPKDTEEKCWVPCPDPSYSTEEWDRLVTLELVFSSLSFVAMAFLLTTSLLDPVRRKIRLTIPIAPQE